MSTIVATADPTTGSVLLDIEQSQVRDVFTRVVANGWGSATTGQAWTAIGGAAGDYSVNGTQGLHTFATTATPRRTTVVSAVDSDMGASVQVTIAVLALTAAITPGVMVRYTDANNHYYLELSLNPANPPTLRIRKVVLGVDAAVSASVALDQSHVAGATWLMRLEICGTSLKGKAWRSTVTEPGWIVTGTDSDLTTGVNAGVRSNLATGNTNGSTVFTYDNFVSYVSQPVRVWRVTPDAARTELRGSPLYTEAPTATAATAIATAWDNEVPFDTSVFYELTSACSTVAEATSSTTTLASNGNGWIRDPENPGRNIKLTFSNLAFNTCDTAGEFALLDWDSRTSRNASGQFDTVNSARGRLVAMTRKRYDSTFYLASKQLTDIDLMYTLMAPGTILMVSLPAAYGFGRPYGSDYISIGDLVETPVNTDDYTDPQRYWEIPFKLEFAPADTDEGATGSNGVGGGGATYGDLAASVLGTTYATLAASGETYQQVAQGVGY